MHAMRWTIAAIVALMILAPAARATVVMSGDFVSFTGTLESQAFGANSNLYVAPLASDRSAFRTLITTLISGNLTSADAQAAAINYDLVQFTDSVGGAVYHGVKETGTPTRGWGSYFVNLSFSSNALIESPHVRFDTNATLIGAEAFRLSGARGFLMAGAHRNANGSGTADVADPISSIFEESHAAWIDATAAAPVTAWQMHGFAMTNHPEMPAGSDVVLSSGKGTQVSNPILRADAGFGAAGFDSYAYNTLSVSNPLNVQVNGDLSGSTFSDLGATQNVEGIYSRAHAALFVHVEMEQSIRLNSDNRHLAAQILADALHVVGDMNGDTLVNVLDIDLLYDHLGDAAPIYDLNGDDAADASDVAFLLNSILHRRPGDANLNGAVDVSDLSILRSHLGQNTGGWAAGDFNGDGNIDVADLALLRSNLGLAPPGLESALFAGFATTIPEPMSGAAWLLGMAGLAMIARPARYTLRIG